MKPAIAEPPVRSKNGTSPSRSSFLRVSLLACLGLVLAWQVLTISFAAYFAGVDPGLALSLAPHNADALLDSAEEILNSDPNGGDPQQDGSTPSPDQPLSPAVEAYKAKGIPVPMVRPSLSDSTRDEIRQAAITALSSTPLDARALRIMGQVADSDAAASTFMRAAAARSLHETSALYWLLQQSFLNGDDDQAVTYADIILRAQPKFSASVVPILGKMAGTPEGLKAVKALLRTNPPWRPSFFSALLRSITDAQLPLDLMLDLQQAGSPPSSDDVRLYLNVLMINKLYELAYYAWLQLLPPGELDKVKLLYNAGFSSDPSGLPFDWTITTGPGAQINIVRHPDSPGSRALYWEFTEGRVDKKNAVRQIVMLAPGSYSFRASEKGDVRARRGLRWRISCYDNLANVLGTSDPLIGNVPTWKEFSFDFTVPDSNCKLQLVSLTVDAISESDRLVTGAAWFADLNLAVKSQ